MKPHELAAAYYLEERGYSDVRPFRRCQLPDGTWLLWFDIPQGELLLHLSWLEVPEEWKVFTVYFDVD